MKPVYQAFLANLRYWLGVTLWLAPVVALGAYFVGLYG